LIGFSSDRDGERDIWVMDAFGGSGVSNLTDTNLSEESWPAWSRDGTKITFDLVNSLGRQIYKMDADGSNRTNLSNDTSIIDTISSWSPDRTKIAFGTSRDGDLEIYVMNADGSNKVNLTQSASSTVGQWLPIPNIRASGPCARPFPTSPEGYR
jgi:TolB protein